MKTIQIHSNKQISLSMYLTAWKTLKQIPIESRNTLEVKESLCTWWPVTVNECLKQYSDAVHDRINQRVNGKYLPINFISK